MKLSAIYRNIKGMGNCLCLDIGVDDLDRAEQNREIVKEGLYLDFWKQYEAWLNSSANHNLGFLFEGHRWLPKNDLPEISKQERKSFNGGGRDEFGGD